MRARRLARKRADSRGLHADVGPGRHEMPEQTLRHRTPANVPGANKQDIFDRVQYAQSDMSQRAVQALCAGSFPLSCYESQDSMTALNTVSAVDHIQALYRLLLIRTGQRIEAERALNETLTQPLQSANGSPTKVMELFRKALNMPVFVSQSPEKGLAGWPLALHHLPEPERSAITLFYLEIFNPRDLAGLLGLEIEELARIIDGARQTLESNRTESNNR